VNCAPKALAFPAPARTRVLELAREHDLLVVGASDNHGWGKATCVWNLSSPIAHGFRSNRILARPIALAQADWQPWTAAYTQPWLMLRGLSWSERSSWLTWVLVILIYRAVPRRQGDPGGIGILARSLSLKILKLHRSPPRAPRSGWRPPRPSRTVATSCTRSSWTGWWLRPSSPAARCAAVTPGPRTSSCWSSGARAFPWRRWARPTGRGCTAPAAP